MEVKMFIITQNINNRNIEDFDDFDILTDEKDEILIFEEEREAIKFMDAVGINISLDNNVQYSSQGDINVSRLH
tara:strand:+ start:550 stop:771 length:222 start_codon:yes stop_codon:yes gene_type:complete